jgi:hypothetical protein
VSRPSSGSRAWRRAAIGWLLTIASLASNAGLPRYCEPPPDLSAAQRDSLLRAAQAVAAATGGLFGVFGNVEKAERDALAELARRLEVG